MSNLLQPGSFLAHDRATNPEDEERDEADFDPTPEEEEEAA